MLFWRSPLLRLFGPLAAAYLLIQLEPYLTVWSQRRPGLLVVAMVALLGGMLLPHVRQLLIVTLCFGISLLALQDTFRPVLPPPTLDYAIVERMYPFAWALLALLAAIAGLMEALKPGSVWARRFYFGAASLYLSGRGLNGLLRYLNWESTVLLVTGIVAGVGVFFAHRIVAAEVEALGEEMVETQGEHSARRAATVAAREWRDKPEEMPQ